MSRRSIVAVLVAAAVVLVGAPLVWLLGRPSDVAGDPASVEAALTSTTATAPALTTTTTDPGGDQPTVVPSWGIPTTQGGSLEVFGAEQSSVPVGLEIAGLRVDAPVEPYGVGRNGEMDVPGNTRDVAWYRHGPSPGEPGSAVLAAQVDLGGRRGVFYRLGTLEPGDLVTVTYDDGSRRDFRVAARAEYTKEELPTEAIFSRQGDPVLTLITCGGGFNPSLRSYDSNIVVYAVPAEGWQPVPAT